MKLGNTDRTGNLRLMVAIAAVMAAVLLVSQPSLASENAVERYRLEPGFDAFEISITRDASLLPGSADVLPAAEYQVLSTLSFRPQGYSIYDSRDAYRTFHNIRAPPP